MATQTIDETWLARKADWVDRVTRLIDEVERWATAEGWAVHRFDKNLKESVTGEYIVPMLRMRGPHGELFLTPIALRLAGGGDGRVDLEAWPSMNRVRFIGKGDTWEIITDSNVPLRQSWNRDTFVQLARDLQG